MKLKVSFAFTWSSVVRASVLLLLLAAFGFACYSLPVEKDDKRLCCDVYWLYV
ncbi:putative transmembrane protein TMEM64 [Helianthus annuus]|nr:putative transmembrane protein TMEM64 [Helianthus annuus]